MYDIYYHKQAGRSFASSPDSDLGFTQNPNVDSGITAKQGIGIGVIAARVLPSAKQVFNTALNATGNKRLQKTVKRVGAGIGFGTTALAVGLPAAVAAEVIKFSAEVIVGDIQNDIDTINQAYVTQKNGASINKFIGNGAYYD